MTHLFLKIILASARREAKGWKQKDHNSKVRWLYLYQQCDNGDGEKCKNGCISSIELIQGGTFGKEEWDWKKEKHQIWLYKSWWCWYLLMRWGDWEWRTLVGQELKSSLRSQEHTTYSHSSSSLLPMAHQIFEKIKICQGASQMLGNLFRIKSDLLEGRITLNWQSPSMLKSFRIFHLFAIFLH